jgi:hypothetical protein
VVLRNKFSYACVKEVCRLWAQPCFDTFHHLLMASSSRRWTGGSHSEQDQGCKEGGQTTPSWNAGAVRAAICGCALSWRSTTLDVSIPRFLFWMALISFFSVLQYKTWLSLQVADDKCLSSSGNYAEK